MPTPQNTPRVEGGFGVKVGTPVVKVIAVDQNGRVTRARGATVPTDGDAGYAIGCIFTKNSGNAVGATIYVNEGTTTSADFNGMKSEVPVMVTGGTIATTSTTDVYIVAAEAGVLASLSITPLVALATSDSNYITWTATNLGQAGAGSTAMLSTADTNTTKATGGTALAVSTVRAFVLSGTASALVVAKGDLIRVRATATGTLANTVTVPVYMARFA